MSMKPAGKAIVVAAVALVVGGGVYFSGALNKLPKQEAPVAEQAAPEPTPVAVERPRPVEVAPVVEAPVTSANDSALDALISKGSKK